MDTATTGFKSILVATDFSTDADAAFKQAVWLARQSHAKIVLAHTRRDLRNAMHGSSYEARLDFFYGKGDLFQQELRRDSDAKLQQMIANADVKDLEIQFETLLGEPFVQLTHAVQCQGHDLVLAGTRGLAAWKQFFVGSTAKKLIRSCPADVWIVKSHRADPPKVVLASTDFSDVSLKAASKALWVAQHANAEFHLLHVIDSTDVPADRTSLILRGGPLEKEITADAKRRLDALAESLHADPTHTHVHLSWGAPWEEVQHASKRLAADLIALGTVGRSGVSGMLLGNTAESVLDTCDCSILIAKPDDFVSPIDPNFWPLIPAPHSEGTESSKT